MSDRDEVERALDDASYYFDLHSCDSWDRLRSLVELGARLGLQAAKQAAREWDDYVIGAVCIIDAIDALTPAEVLRKPTP